MLPPISSSSQATTSNNCNTWISKHRKNLHSPTNFTQNASITYFPSAIGATGAKQIQQFCSLYPTAPDSSSKQQHQHQSLIQNEKASSTFHHQHPIMHPSNRLISRIHSSNSRDDDESCSSNDSGSISTSIVVVEQILMTIEHNVALPYLIPGIGPTRNTATIPVTFIVHYQGDLIQTLHVHWDNALLYPLLGIPLVNCPLAEPDLIVSRAMRPSVNDFGAKLELEQLSARSNSNSLAKNNAAAAIVASENLPISKRSTINHLFTTNDFDASEPTSSLPNDDLGSLSSVIGQMEITPRKPATSNNNLSSSLYHQEKPILGIGPSKQLQSNLFSVEAAAEIEDSHKSCSSAATPIQQSKMQKTTQIRIFGVEGEEDESSLYAVSSHASSTTSLTAERIFACGLDDDDSKVTDCRPIPLVKPTSSQSGSSHNQGTTNRVAETAERIFSQEAQPFSPFIPTYSAASKGLQSTNPFTAEASPFKPALASSSKGAVEEKSTKKHEDLKTPPLRKLSTYSNASQISFGCEDEDQDY